MDCFLLCSPEPARNLVAQIVNHTYAFYTRATLTEHGSCHWLRVMEIANDLLSDCPKELNGPFGNLRSCLRLFQNQQSSYI